MLCKDASPWCHNVKFKIKLSLILEVYVVIIAIEFELEYVQQPPSFSGGKKNNIEWTEAFLLVYLWGIGVYRWRQKWFCPNVAKCLHILKKTSTYNFVGCSRLGSGQECLRLKYFPIMSIIYTLSRHNAYYS